MARSGPIAPRWRAMVLSLVAAVLLVGCGVPDDIPTPTPTARMSPTPAATVRPSPTPTRASTPEPQTPPAATPTVGATPSPLSLRPTATSSPTPTAGATSTRDTSELIVPATTTATAPHPGPIATVAIVQPEATATLAAVATVAATLPPEPTPTPTPVPEPTATATLVPEPTPTPDLCPGAIPWYEAINHLDEEATVIGPVVDSEWAEESQGKPTFLNLGLAYPDPGRFTVLIWIDGRWNFDFAPEEVYLGSTVCVSGTIVLYEGSAEMEVHGPEWIWVP